jgi:Fe-S-cluster containining protein
MKKSLSAKRKSELCLQCGKCCMAMTFFGGEVDEESRDEIRWMELHGLKIDYVRNDDKEEYYFTIPQRCNALQEIKAVSGATNYVCGVYETRPQMCRDYDGSVDGPTGVADCLWRVETERLVQLERR